MNSISFGCLNTNMFSIVFPILVSIYLGMRKIFLVLWSRWSFGSSSEDPGSSSNREYYHFIQAMIVRIVKLRLEFFLNILYFTFLSFYFYLLNLRLEFSVISLTH